MINQRPACDLAAFPMWQCMSRPMSHAVAKVEPGSTFAMSRCDSLRQPATATGVSPVAKLVATHVAADKKNRAMKSLCRICTIVILPRKFESSNK